jgi:hypothetical protein
MDRAGAAAEPELVSACTVPVRQAGAVSVDAGISLSPLRCLGCHPFHSVSLTWCRCGCGMRLLDLAVPVLVQ